MTYEDLVRAIGPGFHPDTEASDYTSLPDGVTVRECEKIVLNAHLAGNATKRAWAVFQEQGWIG